MAISSGTTYEAVQLHHNTLKADKSAAYGPPASHVVSRKGYDEAFSEISCWPGYGQTPLHDLSGLAAVVGIWRLYYKDEGDRFGLGSFKALGGAYAVKRLLKGCNPDEVTVACATDGNHGRSVAWGAQMAGCRCVIYIHKGVSEARKLAIEAFGAEVRRCDGDYDASVRIAAIDAEREGWIVVSDTSYDGYMEIPGIVMQGYTVMVQEVLEQLPIGEIPTHVFLQGGVGGLAGAVVGHFWETFGEDRPRFVIVEPERADCLFQSALAGRPSNASGDLETIMAGLSCGEISLIAWDILAPGTDDFLTIPDDMAADAMRRLANPEPGDTAIVAGESAVAGLAVVLAAGKDRALADALGLTGESRVLVIGSEGATDPELYRSIVGRSADKILAS